MRALVARRIRALGLSGDALVLRLWRLVDLGTTPQPVVDRVTGEVVRREDGSLAESLNPALASTAVKAATLLAKIMGEGAGPRPLPGLRTDEAAAGRQRALDALGGVLQKVRSIT